MTPADARLLINNDGDFDIECQDRPLLGMGSKKMATLGFDGFHRTQRLTSAPVGAEGLEDETVARMTRRMEDAFGAPFPANPSGPECYHLAVLGFGLGDHLPGLVAATRCRNLVIVEPNMEFLYLSLFTFDWTQFIQAFNTDEKRVQIIFEAEAKMIELNFRECIRFIAPHYVDGLTLVNTYADAELDAAFELIVSNARFLHKAIGFILDECDMMRNACNNLRRHRGHYYKRRDNHIPIPALVVGSGPSLNDGIDFIRENQDRAVIISCGTALRVLKINGITPDFHVEMENTIEIPDIIAAEAAANDISSVRLIASYTVAPGISQHFSTAVYYFRADLAPTPLFSLGDDTAVQCSVPTVANLGVAFAQEFGCRDVYMFGVDLGAKDNVTHHAKGSAYETGEAPYRSNLDIPMPTNFDDGEILTDTVFLWAKDSLELAVMRYPGTDRRHFNCSNGLRIDGMTPLRASEISISDAPRPKAEIIDTAMAHYPMYTDEHFHQAWNHDERLRLLDEFRDILLSHLSARQADKMPNGLTSEKAEDLKPGISRQERRRLAKMKKKQEIATKRRIPVSGENPAFEHTFMDRLTRQFYPDTGTKTVEDHFFQGSLFYLMQAIGYYVQRTPAGPVRDKIIDIGKQELERHINGVADQARALYASLE